MTRARERVPVARELRRIERRRVVQKRRLTIVIALLPLVVFAFWLAWTSGAGDYFTGGPPSITVVRVITGPGTGDLPQFARPLSAAWGPRREIHVSDTENKRVCVFAENGRFIREYGRDTTASASASVKARSVMMPVGVDVDTDGTAYVADLRAAAVLVYDPQGRFVRALAPRAAEGWRPTDVAVGDGLVYVTDVSGVEVFTTKGQRRGRLAIGGDHTALSRPNGIAVGGDGTIHISDTNQLRVLAVNPEGQILYSAGTVDEESRVFGLPRGLGVFEDGSAVVADAFSFALKEVGPDGAIVNSWGVQGATPGRFSYPNDVDVADDLVVVADKENDRVQVLRLGRSAPVP